VTDPSARPHVTTIGRLLFALMLLVYLATAGGSLTTTDAVATFDVTRSIVEHRSVAMSANLLGREGERGRDGRYYSPFGIGQSLFNLPFYVAAKAFVGVTGVRIGKPDSLAKAFVALGETVLVAAIVQQFFYFAVEAIGDVGAAAFAALTMGLASVLWPYARFGFNQPLACLTLLVASRAAFTGTRRASPRSLVYSGLWLAGSLMTRHEMALAAGPIAGWLWFDGRRPWPERVRRLVLLAPGLLAGVGAWLFYNAIRFGNPFDAGYLRDPSPGFGSPMASGVAALVASPSASVFLYSPVALAGVVGLGVLSRTGARSVAVFCSAMILCFLAFYANLGNWLGGRSYGSRYLVVVLPYFGIGWAALLAALAPHKRRLLLALVGVFGFAIQVPGVCIDYAKVSQSLGAVQQPFTTEDRQWRWEAAPLVLNTRALVHALPDNVDYLLGRRQPPPVAAPVEEADRSFSQQFSFSLDLWWLYLYYLHVFSRSAVAMVVAAFVTVIGCVGHRLWQLLPDPNDGQ
jgi:hypothetical protein